MTWTSPNASASCCASAGSPAVSGAVSLGPMAEVLRRSAESLIEMSTRFATSRASPSDAVTRRSELLAAAEVAPRSCDSISTSAWLLFDASRRDASSDAALLAASCARRADSAMPMIVNCTNSRRSASEMSPRSSRFFFWFLLLIRLLRAPSSMWPPNQAGSEASSGSSSPWVKSEASSPAPSDVAADCTISSCSISLCMISLRSRFCRRISCRMGREVESHEMRSATPRRPSERAKQTRYGSKLWGIVASCHLSDGSKMRANEMPVRTHWEPMMTTCTTDERSWVAREERRSVTMRAWISQYHASSMITTATDQ
mmetsp:Transcript_61141/g.167731  ORF Transcript_61141/g.167731 Transcript_61141/m.167731 type:complete len:315 (+) Transcript_61141:800-1744(+)